MLTSSSLVSVLRMVKSRMKRPLWLGYLIVLLVVSIVILGHNKQWSSYSSLSAAPKKSFWLECEGHLEVCWMRTIIQHQDVYNLSLSGDIYDFTALHQYMMASALEVVRGPATFDWRFENPLTIKLRADLNTEYKNKGLRPIKALGGGDSDYLGRTAKFKPEKEYKYEYKIEFKSESKSVVVSIEERPLVNQSDVVRKVPNAIYGVIRTQDTSSECENQFFFPNNRTYIIICPVFEENFRITLNITYLDVSAYSIAYGQKLMHPLRNITFKDLTISDQKATRTDTLLLKEQKVELCKDDQMKNPASRYPHFWIKIKNQWHWYTKDCFYPYYLTEKQIKCLKSERILFIGDSHAVYREKDISAAYNLTNLEVTKSSFALHLVTVLNDWLNNVTKQHIQPHDWLILNTGHHDQRYLDPVLYIAYMSEVFSLIDKIKIQLKKPPGFVWVQTTDTENWDITNRMFNKRLNHAWNDWTGYELMKRGVGVVPASDIASAMPGHTKDKIHHFNHFGMEKVPGGLSIGGAAIATLIGIICQG